MTPLTILVNSLFMSVSVGSYDVALFCPHGLPRRRFFLLKCRNSPLPLAWPMTQEKDSSEAADSTPVRGLVSSFSSGPSLLNPPQLRYCFPPFSSYHEVGESPFFASMVLEFVSLITRSSSGRTSCLPPGSRYIKRPPVFPILSWKDANAPLFLGDLRNGTDFLPFSPRLPQ